MLNLYTNAISEGHKEGYAFHQQKVKENPELKEWIIKNNYL
jgi:hypothetical protein